MNKLVLKYLKIWVFPLFFVIALGAAFSAWAEKQMRVPGGFYDVRFLEQTFSSVKKSGDLVFLSDYFAHRTAEVLALSNRDPEALLLYEYIGHVLRVSDFRRDISDLKYAIAVYKKQLLISTPPTLRIYISFCENLNLLPTMTMGQELMTDSDARISAMEQVFRGGTESQSTTNFESLLSRPEFSKVKSIVMTKIAYDAYEDNSGLAMQWIDRAKKSSPPQSVRYVLEYLERKIGKKKQFVNHKAEDGEVESKFLKSLRLGLFQSVKERLQNEKDQTAGMLRLRETESWLDLEPNLSEKEKQPFFSAYFQALRRHKNNPVEISDELAALAVDRDWSMYSSFLRYQAWGMAFFDARDFSRAVLFKDFLKTYDPLSLFSQLESMGGTFKFSVKEFVGEELMRVWEQTGHLFDKKRNEDWDGFESRKKRVAKTIVYSGQVYVVNYDSSGQAQKMQIVGMNQVASEKKPVLSTEGPEKMGWVDKFFYDFMVQFIPDGVTAFKEQIAKLASRRKEAVFTRLYTEFEFKEYVLKVLDNKYGGIVKGVQAQIDERGFFLYGVFDLKVMSVPASGLGKIITEDESGQLILKLDHVKVNGLKLPDWLLRKIEKNFNLTANTANGVQALEILDMQYQSGGVQMKCRSSMFKIYGNAAAAA